jgi:hypothetical protein
MTSLYKPIQGKDKGDKPLFKMKVRKTSLFKRKLKKTRLFKRKGKKYQPLQEGKEDQLLREEGQGPLQEDDREDKGKSKVRKTSLFKRKVRKTGLFKRKGKEGEEDQSLQEEGKED